MKYYEDDGYVLCEDCLGEVTEEWTEVTGSAECQRCFENRLGPDDSDVDEPGED